MKSPCLLSSLNMKTILNETKYNFKHFLFQVNLGFIQTLNQVMHSIESND